MINHYLNGDDVPARMRRVAREGEAHSLSNASRSLASLKKLVVSSESRSIS